ncbi:MAG: hsdS 1 [Gammaproteobacteria bacterium]|jgi:type I restriction enzyme S subunit|nr:hsdS 1 [Gammaproteobacteria bacterium]
MKNNWQTKKLGEVFEIKPPKKEVRSRLSDNDLVSFVPMEDLGQLKKGFVVTKEKSLQEVYGGYTYFADNDLLLAKITPCFENGKIGIARNLKNGVGFGSSEYIIFRSKGELLPDYLYYFLIRDEFRKEGSKVMTGAVGHKRVPKDFVENQHILYPESLSEQQRIVKILDEAFESIAKAKENIEKNLQNARELFESCLQNIFANLNENWQEKKLKDITTKIGSGATPLGGERSYKSEGISLIRSLNVYDHGFREKGLACLDKDQADKLSNVIVEPGDILLNITGASVARSCIVPDEILPARVNQHVSIIRPIKEIMISKFLHFALISKVYKDKLLLTGAKGGATRQAITKAQIENFFIKYPSVQVQQSIVAKLDALSAETKKLEAIYKQKLSLLDELKKSIFKKAFSGEL